VGDPIEEVRVKLSADTTAFFGQVDGAVNGATTRMGKIGTFLQSSVVKWGAMIAGAAAGFASWRTLESAISSTQDLGLAVGKLSRETGLSAEASSQLLFAFKHFGLEADDASRSIGIFAKKLKGVSDEETGVTTGGKSTAQILADIGVKATDAAGNLKPMMDILLPLADQFQTMPDGLEKTGLAMQLFGRSGKDMIPLLNAGSEGLKELAGQADKLGLTLTAKNVAAIKAYTFAQRGMNEALGGLKLMLGLAVMPVLTRFLQWLISVQPAARAFLDNVIKKFRAAADAARPFVEATKRIAQVFDAVGADLVDLIIVLTAAAAGFAALNFAADAIDLATLIIQTIQLQMALATTTTVMASLRAAMLTLPGILMMVTVAFLVINQACQIFLGFGLLDALTGAGAAAKRNAAFLKEFGDNVARIDALTREGASPEQAHLIRLNELAKSSHDLTAETKALADAGDLGFKGALHYKEGMEVLGKQLIDLHLTYEEWLAVLKQAPDLTMVSDVRDAVDEARQAFIDLNVTQRASYPKELISRIFATGAAIQKTAKDITDAITAFGTATDQLTTVYLDKLGGSLERLELERTANRLEALKTKLGDAFKDQAALDQVNGKLDLLDRRDQAVTLSLQVVGERLREAFGAHAADKIDAIANAIADMPDEKAIEILPLLDVLRAKQIITFMDYLKRGVTVNVALAMALYNIPSVAISPAVKFALPVIEKAIGVFGEQAAAAAQASFNLDQYGGSVAAAGDKTAAATDQTAAATDQFTDFTDTLDETTKTLLGLGRAAGMTDQQLAGYPWTLDLARRAAERLGLTTDDLLDIFNRTGAGFADFMRALAASESLDQLKKISDAVVSSLSDLRNQFNTLFGAPTKEQAAINYQVAQLKLRRAQMVAGGATEEALAGVDRQIAKMEAVNTVRQAEVDVMRAQLDMADKTLLTDAQQFAQGQNLVAKMADLSAAAQPVIDLYRSQAALMQGWMDSLSKIVFMAAALPLPAAQVPSAQTGGIVPGPRGQPQLIIAHGGEAVLPLGSSLSFAMPITVNVSGGTPDWTEVLRRAQEAVAEAVHGARQRSYLQGAPLGSGIG